jgi:4-diphosphocytidyl-2-C-methyl-D-erythritol kinase
LIQREECPRVRLRTYAKINLTLEVIRRRPDGYHELRSVFQAVSLYDELSITIRDTAMLLAAAGWSVPRDASNLCIQAAQLFAAETGWPQGLDMDLYKSIPVGGGLGGGSSNAAAVLRGLNYLSGDQITEIALREMGAQLGSDVPFFLGAGTALASGRGEQLSEFYTPRMDWWGVILHPGFEVPTGAAYQALIPELDFTDGARTVRLWHALNERADLQTIAGCVCNAFRRSLEEGHDELRQLRAELRRAGAVVAEVTGSGSCVYGLFATEELARATSRDLRAAGRWARVVQPVLLGVEIIEACEGSET